MQTLDAVTSDVQRLFPAVTTPTPLARPQFATTSRETTTGLLTMYSRRGTAHLASTTSPTFGGIPVALDGVMVDSLDLCPLWPASAGRMVPGVVRYGRGIALKRAAVASSI